MTDRELLEGIFSELKEVRNDIDRLEKKLEVQMIFSEHLNTILISSLKNKQNRN